MLLLSFSLTGLQLCFHHVWTERANIDSEEFSSSSCDPFRLVEGSGFGSSGCKPTAKKEVFMSNPHSGPAFARYL